MGINKYYQSMANWIIEQIHVYMDIYINLISINTFSQLLEKEMATHSSVLAWRIPGTGKPGGLPSMGSHRVGHNWNDLAVAAGEFNSFKITTSKIIIITNIL